MPSPSTELGAFLRARREQVRPADVGLPDSGRRRTPGLRREEVAILAGISVDYLVRLEQGRDTRPSASVLTAIGNALLLDEVEMRHLRTIGLISGNSQDCAGPRTLVSEVEPTVHALLDGLNPIAAFVLGPANDVLAANPAWRDLVDPIGLAEGDPPNLARFVFVDPRSRDVYVDWDSAADVQAGQLRAAALHWTEEPRFTALVAELRRLPEFERRWARHPVAEKRRGRKRLRHPVLGDLLLAFEVLLLPDGAQRLVTWLPADQATATALREQQYGSGDEPRLRVVGDD